jgi:hypothetical protein
MTIAFRFFGYTVCFSYENPLPQVRRLTLRQEFTRLPGVRRRLAPPHSKRRAKPVALVEIHV